MLSLDNFQLNPQTTLSATGLQMRLWYLQTFIDVNGETVLVNTSSGKIGPYIPFDCTITSGIVSVLAENIFTTIDANVQNPQSIQCCARLFSNGSPKDWVWNQWVIPSEAEYPGGVITKEQLTIYNEGSNTLANPPSTYLTTAQTIAYFATLDGGGADASALVKGITKLSVAPISATNPIALGQNDPAVGNLHGELSLGRVPRALLTDSLEDGQILDDDTTGVSIQILTPFQAGDWEAEGNNSYIDVSDEDGTANLFAGSDAQAEYAGIAAVCDGDAEVFVQSTGFTNLYGHKAITKVGDGIGDGNSTQIVIDDDAQTAVLNGATAISITNGPSLQEGRLSSTASVNLNTATATTLYTCPTGKSCVVTKVIMRNASTSLTLASVSFGWNSASFNNVIANATHTELTGSTLYTVLDPKIGATVGLTTGVLKVLCNTLQGGAATATIEVFGYTF